MVVKVGMGRRAARLRQPELTVGVAGGRDGVGCGLIQVGEHLELDAMLTDVREPQRSS